MIALFVTLDVRPELRDRFVEAIASQGAASLAREPGCLRFDVCVDTESPNRFLLYEVYEDEAALEAHGATPHFALWREAAAQCVERQVNTVTSVVTSGRAEDPGAA
jgi:quinol monooxygenase YgiN